MNLTDGIAFLYSGKKHQSLRQTSATAGRSTVLIANEFAHRLNLARFVNAYVGRSPHNGRSPRANADRRRLRIYQR